MRTTAPTKEKSIISSTSRSQQGQQDLPLPQRQVKCQLISTYYHCINFPAQQSTVLKQAGKVSSWVIRPRQWNSVFKTTTTKYVTIHRANEGKKHSVKASLEQSHCSMGQRDQAGHSKDTLLLSDRRDRQQNNCPCVLLVLYVICNSSFSFSIYFELVLLYFLFVFHTCDFLPSHHKFLPNKTICTAIATL